MWNSLKCKTHSLADNSYVALVVVSVADMDLVFKTDFFFEKYRQKRIYEIDAE